ncbi:MAG: endolytic transglycosylase MltG [Alicyclobacillaceae bacterium]|nr:endolytic transglycosylase MltG [Alicyclobacillaceae bacterium]
MIQLEGSFPSRDNPFDENGRRVMIMQLFSQRNVLLEFSIHREFRQGVRDLGCLFPGPEVFNPETLQFLIAHLEINREQMKNLKKELHQNLSSASILATEDLGDGRFSFVVRIPYRRYLIDLRLIYHRDQWQCAGVTAISRRPLWKRPRVIGSVLVASYVIVAFVAGTWTQYKVSSDEKRLAELASRAGYVLVPASGAGVSSRAPQTSPPKTAEPAPTPGAGQQVTFTLQTGMSASDVTQFLHNQGLVQDVGAFNRKLTDTHVDQSLKPGTYTFRKGMTVDEIVQTLEKGPQS